MQILTCGRQFFVFDALECLPTDASGALLPIEEVEGECSRYDGQIMCVGKTLQRRLERLKYVLSYYNICVLIILCVRILPCMCLQTTTYACRHLLVGALIEPYAALIEPQICRALLFIEPYFRYFLVGAGAVGCMQTHI